ncbi:hypothetical protein [Nocardia terpenica]|uniref:hypothetical protein n=1 Tax=Nocardia terpenica TaxID=455432 RepID=UPI000AA363E7|nr:hypothetical protein [Nocardia terpenica]
MIGRRSEARRRAVTLSAILWVLIASGCAGEMSASPKPAGAVQDGAISQRPFVFRSRNELVLATAERVIARHPGHYIDSGFAQDDSHVFALDAAGRLTALETTAGTVLANRIDCRCDRVFPLHDTVLGWWQQPDTFVQADLRDPNSPARTPISLPPPRDPIAPGNVLSPPRLLAADARTLVIDRVESPPGATWGINHLFVTETATGATRPLARVEGINTALTAAALHPDGRSVALPGYRRDGTACGTARVLTVETAAGGTENLDLPELARCSTLTDLRWNDTVLTGAVLSWEPGSPDRLTTSAVWARRESRWERCGGDDALRCLPLTASSVLEIRRPGHDRVHTAHPGDLVLATGTESRVLARDVVDIHLARR